MNLRLGMIGTGRIARRFATDGWQTSGAELTAVYNPREESVTRFAGEHAIPCGTMDWNLFLAQTDAVYVAAPPGVHGSYVEKLLRAGKHVLCEKPMVLNRKEAEKLFELAKKKNLILMEAIKTACCPGFQKLTEVVKNGCIGELRDVEATFTKLVRPGVRELVDRKCGGSLTELGSYGCFAVLRLFGCDFEKVHFSVQRSRTGMDIFTRVFFEYPGERASGIATAGLGVKSEGELIVSGTQGYIVARAPWWMTSHFEVRYENPEQRDVYDFPFVGNGLQYELHTFLDRIRGKVGNGWVTPEESIALAGVMENFLEREIIQRK